MIFVKAKKVWYWPHPIYLYPLALSWEDWDLFRAKIKKRYPVQYFFRETLPINLAYFKSKIENFFASLKFRIYHPRKQMRDKIFAPRWEDLDSMLENFAHEMVKEFVEKERALEHFGDHRSKFTKELNNHYKYVKYDRQKIIDAIQELDDSDIATYEDMQTKLIKKDDALLLWLVKNRKYFWT